MNINKKKNSLCSKVLKMYRFKMIKFKLKKLIKPKKYRIIKSHFSKFKVKSLNRAKFLKTKKVKLKEKKI
jgi:hypothetical protein